MRILQLIVLVFLLGVTGIASIGCTKIQIRETMKEHNIIVKPGKSLQPRTYENGVGNTELLDMQPGHGNTFMVIVRGRL